MTIFLGLRRGAKTSTLTYLVRMAHSFTTRCIYYHVFQSYPMQNVVHYQSYLRVAHLFSNHIYHWKILDLGLVIKWVSGHSTTIYM